MRKRIARIVKVGCMAAFMIALGYVGANDPRVYVVLLAALMALVVCRFIYRRPGAGLAVSFFLLLIAQTKFRSRNPLESVSGVADWQVQLELGMFAAVAFITGLAMVSRSIGLPRLSAMERVLLAFVAWAALSVLWSSAPLLTVVRAVQLGIAFCLVVVSIRVLGTARALSAIGGAVLVYVVLCSGLAAVFPWAATWWPAHAGYTRFTWFAVHPIVASTFTAIAALFVIAEALFCEGGWRRRRFGLPLWMYLPPLAVVLVLANCRGPLFSFLAAAGSLFLLRYLRPWTALPLFAAVATVVLALQLSGSGADAIVRRMTSGETPVSEVILRGGTPQEFASLSGRVQLWRDMWPFYLSRPLLGYGYQASRPVLLRIRPWAGHAHNALLQWLMDLGVIGAVLFWLPLCGVLWLIFLPHEHVPSERAWERATILSIVIFLVLNSISNESFAGAPGYELTLAVMAILGGERLRSAGRRRAEVILVPVPA